MGVANQAGSGTEQGGLKIAGGAVLRARGGGTLAHWNERLAVLEGSKDAIANEMAVIDGLGAVEIGGGMIARVDRQGCLRIGSGPLLSHGAAHSLRDHLCNVLGLPEVYQPLLEVDVLTDDQAATLARQIFGGPSTRPSTLAFVEQVVREALDHVGALHSDTTTTPSATRQAVGGEANHESAKPQANAPAASTAGSAQKPNATSEDWADLHGLNVDGNAKDQAARVDASDRQARQLGVAAYVCGRLACGHGHSLATHYLPDEHGRITDTTLTFESAADKKNALAMVQSAVVTALRLANGEFPSIDLKA